ncbi:TetR/AcrR family transcriptional regulator [Martelella endophytica]|uniref:HTH tetR-type domain-containing protein n=1 Tax=Martelella endophytica TaxID=1486262 RepID=A0A0D5LKA9_MAREN|nr:TetR/AcrR family transcriptional regulator [Martelella endophytica]AJY44586.1 hypothetical protein TM49_01075 [Martelella endophytica]
MAEKKRDVRATRKRSGPEVRRQAVLDAALSTFAEKGFANARIEDIARAAGVGKGTVYLYFPDKESLFKSLVGTYLTPHIEQASRFFETPSQSPRATLSAFYSLIQNEVLNTERADLVRLMITEMPTFPEIAQFYHDNLIEPAMQLVQRLLAVAHERGELRSPHALKAPQMVAAPIVMSVVWGSLFANFGTLDRQAAFELSLDTLFRSPAEDTP